MTRHAATRLAALAAATTTALLGLPLLPATPAAAAPTITVTTTTDAIDSGDGLTSLREAVSQANAAGDATEIVLAPGANYPLSLCPAGADDNTNATGDLDLTSPYDVTITGNGATVTQTCSAVGLLHALPLASGDPALALTGITITGPTASWGILVGSDPSLPPFAHRHLIGTDLEVRDFVQASGGLMIAGSTQLTNAHVHDASFTSEASAVHSRGVLTMADSTFEDIGLSSDGFALIGDDGATIDRSSFLRNGPFDIPLPLASFPTQYDTGPSNQLPFVTIGIEGAAVVRDSRFDDNVARMGTVAAGDLTMADSTLHHNWNAAGTVFAEHFALDRVTVDGNGGGLVTGIVGGGTVRDSTISNNVVVDDGTHSKRGAGFDLLSDTTIERSTIAGNHGPTVGAITADADLTVHESTFAANSSSGVTSSFDANAADDIAFRNPGHTMTLRNSVLGPDGTQLACNLAGTTALSQGHNFDSDGTCGLSDPSDVSAGGDPLLGVLADNGGVTETMLPLPGSPLLDAVPAASAGCVGETSQNGLALPQGLGCEIGAAEVPSTAALAGHVTSSYTGLPLAGIEVRVRSLANTNVATTTTGPDGTWTIAGLAAGDYKVLFRDPSGEHNQTFNGSAWPFSAAPAVNVAGDHTTVVDQALTVDNAITGTVTDTQTGLPVAGVQVRVRTAANTYIRTATTNADGTYTIADLAPGDYKLLFRDPTGAHEQAFNSSAWPFSAAPTITVTDDAVTIDQALVPVPAIDGTVTDDGTGTPLAGIEIRVRTLTNTYLGSTTTAPDGTWTIHLPAGTYKLLYTDPTGTHLTEWHDNKPGFATATPITHTAAGETLTASLAPAP